MADKDKSQEKSKSSFFRSKSDGKKESKTKDKSWRKRQRLGSRGASADNICESQSVKVVENAKENLTKPSSSKTDFVSNQPNDEISKAEEASVGSTATDSRAPDDLEANLEDTSTNKLVAETNASKEQHANDKPSENAETSAILDGKEQSDKLELTAVVEQAGLSGEQGEPQIASHVKQTEDDVENKATEVTTAGGSKKHGKASGPLASFRRHRKKNKLSKHPQDAESVEKSDGKLNESKESGYSEQPKIVEKSEAKTTEAKIAICKEGEEQQNSSETSNSAVKAVELEGKTAEIPEKIAASGSEMANDKSEEQGTTKKGHKEKKSGPFASFRKNKKKADSVKQPNRSSKSGENKPEDTKGPVETAKENVADNAPKLEKENVLVLDKEMTGKQQQTSAAEGQQSAEPDESNVDNLPAQESEATEERTNLIDEMCDDEKNTEDKAKKGKRFGSFSSFSRAKKAPKLLQQTAQPRPRADNKEKDMADNPSNEQTIGKSNLKENLSGKETEEGDNSSENSKNKELATAEICKDLPSGSELQVPEISTGTGSETNTAEERKRQQEGLDATPEKKKSLKKRISKIRLHSGKNKENQSLKEGANNRPEVDLKGKNSEAGTSGNEISTQVKRKKSGGLQKKISKALKRNKSGQMELNESYDDPSASEEEFQLLLDDKNPISPTATETKEEITETDGEKQKDQINESPDKVPEVIEEKEEQPIVEQSSSSTTGSVVKRVTFSFDEETIETEEREVSQDQPATSFSNDEQQTVENSAEQETEQDEKRDEDGVTLSEEDDVTCDKEDSVFGVYSMCRDIMKLVFVELFEYVATKTTTQQDTDNQELKTDEDLQKPTIAPDVEPSAVTYSVVQENDSGNLTESSEALSMESLVSTGTVVILESSDSELESVSTIPDEFVSESVEFDNEPKPQENETEKLETVSPIPDAFVSESVVFGNESEPQENQTEKTPEKLEDQTAETEETTTGQPDVEPIQADEPTEVPGPSESNGSEDISQKHGEDSAPSSEVVQPENDPATDEGKETRTDVPETEVSCSPGEVDRVAETSVEQSIEINLEKSLERSLETSLQCLLSQSLKEEWIVVRPRLEISQEMSDQFRSFALESYRHTPVCCKMM